MLTSARIALPRRSSLAASRAVTGTTGRTFASSSTTLQAAPPPKDIELEIDGKMITVPAGSALIQVNHFLLPALIQIVSFWRDRLVRKLVLRYDIRIRHG